MSQPIPPIAINGVPCTFAMADGRLMISESAAEEGPKTTLKLQTAWANRWLLVQALRGTCVGSINSFNRSAPFALPSNNSLVCTSVGEFEYIGSGANDDGSVYSNLVRIPATFSCVPWQFQDGDPKGQNDASGQAWTVTRIKPSSEVYQPTGGTYWVGPFPSTTPLDEASVGFIRSYQEIQITRKFLPALDVATFDVAIGCANSNTMNIGTQSYAPGFMLLVGIESEPYFDSVGNPVCDVTFSYLGRKEASWYKVQDRTATWQFVNSSAAGSGIAPFGSFDFSTLPR
jgi:hypothetical protein